VLFVGITQRQSVILPTHTLSAWRDRVAAAAAAAVASTRISVALRLHSSTSLDTWAGNIIRLLKAPGEWTDLPRQGLSVLFMMYVCCLFHACVVSICLWVFRKSVVSVHQWCTKVDAKGPFFKRWAMVLVKCLKK